MHIVLLVVATRIRRAAQLQLGQNDPIERRSRSPFRALAAMMVMRRPPSAIEARKHGVSRQPSRVRIRALQNRTVHHSIEKSN
jgi:hypothetical protein